jgi:hypothetical protein
MAPFEKPRLCFKKIFSEDATEDSKRAKLP